MWRKIAWSLSLALLVVGLQGRNDLGAATTAAAAAPAAKQTVDEVLAAYVTARGGQARLAAVQTVRMSGIMAGGNIQGLPVTLEKKRPNKYRRVVEDPEGNQVSVFDGHAGWLQHGDEAARPLPPPAVARIRRTAEIDGPLVDYQAKGAKAELLGKEKVGGSDAYVVRLTFDSGDPATFYIDAKSHLLVKSREKVPTSDGLQDAETTYQDYRPSGGVLWPFRQVIVTPANGMTQSFTWSKIDVNIPLDDAQFGAPKP